MEDISTKPLDERGKYEATKIKIALRNLWEGNHNTDVVLQVRDVNQWFKFHVHKLVLAIRSSVFSDLDFMHDKLNVIEITDMSPLGIKKMIRYFYYDDLTCDSALDLIEVKKVASAYDVKPLENLCLDLLSQFSVRTDNACEVLEAALVFESQEVQENCLTYINNNVENILLSDSFMQSSFHTVLKISDGLDMSTKNAALLLASVVEWLSENKSHENREALLSRCHIMFITVREFLKVVNRFPTFFSDEEISSILINMNVPGSRKLPTFCEGTEVQEISETIENASNSTLFSEEEDQMQTDVSSLKKLLQDKGEALKAEQNISLSANEEITKLVQELDELKAQASSSENSLRDALNEEQQQIKLLHATLQQSRDQYESEIASLHSMTQQSQSSLEKLLREKEDALIAEQNGRLSAIERTNNLRQEFDALKNRASSSENSLTYELNKEQEKSKCLNEVMQRNAEEFASEITSLRNEMQERNSSLEKLLQDKEDELNDKQKLCSSANERIIELIQKLDEQKDYSSYSVKSLRDALNQEQQENKYLHSLMERNNEEHQSKMASLRSEMQQRHSSLEKRLHHKEDALKAEQKVSLSAKERSAELLKELDKLKAHASSSENSLRDALNQKQRENDHFHSEMERTGEEYARELASLRSQMQQMKNKMKEEHASALQEQQEENDRLQSLNQMGSEKNKKSSEEISRLQHEIEHLRSSYEKLKTHQGAIQQSNHGENFVLGQNHDYEKTIIELSSKVQLIENARIILMGELQNTRSFCTSLEAENSCLKQLLEEAKHQLDRSKQDVVQHQNSTRVEGYPHGKGAVAHLEEKVKRLSYVNNQQLETIERLRKENEALGAEISRNMDRVVDKWFG